MRNRASLLQRLRVPLGFLFGSIFLLFARPAPLWMAVGLGIAFGGLSLRIWAAGHLRKHRQLSVGGPYRWTRNPLYLGSFLMGLGFTVAATRWWLVLLFGLLFVGVYLPVMKREQGEIEKSYGEESREYIGRVPLFFPGRLPAPLSRKQKFSWREFRRNREYNALMGFLLLSTILILKMKLA